MFVDNVRNSINDLTDDEYQEFLDRLRSVLRRKYNKQVKPSQLKNQVNDFIQGKDPKIDYFEAYLVTFEELSVNGAQNAIHNNKVNMPKTWRELLLKITDDQSLSQDIVKHMGEDEIVREIKALFYNSLEYCNDQNYKNFFENLYHFNKILKIGIDKK